MPSRSNEAIAFYQKCAAKKKQNLSSLPKRLAHAKTLTPEEHLKRREQKVREKGRKKAEQMFSYFDSINFEALIGEDYEDFAVADWLLGRRHHSWMLNQLLDNDVSIRFCEEEIGLSEEEELESFAKLVDTAREQDFDVIIVPPRLMDRAKRYAEEHQGEVQLEGDRMNIFYFVGDASCVYNARSPLFRCAVNPDGDCGSCNSYQQAK